MTLQRYRLLISYDGTPFGGWQVQPNAPSIQGHIQEALQTILREKPLHVAGSGRTDAGVHAQGQVAHFSTTSPVDPKTTLRSLNALLPPEIRILEIAPVDDTFHARYSATGKIYHYHLHLDPIVNPFTRNYTTYFPYRLDLDLINEAIPHFLGKRDFSSFANEQNKGSCAKNPVRTLHRLSLHTVPGGIRLEFEGDGFLYKMVRNIVGTLLDVGLKKLSPDDIPALFAARDRRKASRAAPAQGLFLMHVFYE